MGGLAIKTSKRVPCDQVNEIISSFAYAMFRVFSIPLHAWLPIGSTLKNKSVGDIDLAITPDMLRGLFEGDYPISSKNGFYDQLIQWVAEQGYSYRDSRHVGVVSIEWPFPDSIDVCQIDIMAVCDYDWASWSFYSPSVPDESEYKGLFRNELIFALVKCANSTPLKYDDNGVMVEWERNFFDLNRGVFRGKCSRIGRGGKTIKTVQTSEKTLITSDVGLFVNSLFGSHATPYDVLTFESTIDAMRHADFPLYDILPQVLDCAIEGIKTKRCDVPQILTDLRSEYGNGNVGEI